MRWKFMNFHDRSESRARQILKSYVDSITSEFSEYIYTILLVGSLTNGSYIEGPGSDEVSKLMPLPNIQEELPIRIIVQIILTNAFRHYFYFTGKSCSNKHLIAERIKMEIKNYKFQDLLDLATEIKMNPDKDLPCEKIKQLRNTFAEFQYWLKNYPVDAVPLEV
jgi:hypothetical protein